MEQTPRIDLRQSLRMGLIAGVVALSLSIIGIIELSSKRDIVAGVISSGYIMLFITPIAMAFMATRSLEGKSPFVVLFQGFLTGIIASAPLVILLILAEAVNLRQFFVNVSPGLSSLLTFNLGLGTGTILLVVLFGIVSLAGAALNLIGSVARRLLIQGLAVTLLFGLLSENLVNRLRDFFGQGFINALFRSRALKPGTALILFLVICGLVYWWSKRGDHYRDRLASLPPNQQQTIRWFSIGGVIVLLLILPLLIGTYFSEVIARA